MSSIGYRVKQKKHEDTLQVFYNDRDILKCPGLTFWYPSQRSKITWIIVICQTQAGADVLKIQKPIDCSDCLTRLCNKKMY